MAAACLLLVAGLLGSVLLFYYRSAQASGELLRQASVAAQALDVAEIRGLSFSAADAHTKPFEDLRLQLIQRRAATHVRGIWTAARRGRAIVFGPESYLPDDPLASPPGTVYQAPNAVLLEIFESGRARVAGPYTDEYGTFITALAPVIDRESNTVALVVGVDIDAIDWYINLSVQASWPLACAGMLLLGLVGMRLGMRRADRDRSSLPQRLLLPLAAIVVLLAVGGAALLWHQEKAQQATMAADSAEELPKIFKLMLQQQINGLKASTAFLGADEVMLQALQQGDREKLLQMYAPVFESLRGSQGVTHLYFFDSQRICLLRVHKPEKHGDLIDRYTAREAERTQAPTAGLELGPLGTLTLRVVQPIIKDGRTLGYVELGKEIEDVLDILAATWSRVELAVAVHKQEVRRADWEAGMKMLGREADWDRLTDEVLIFSSVGRFPREFDRALTDRPQGETAAAEIASEGRDWYLFSAPLRDVSGRLIGDFLVLQDLAAAKAQFSRVAFMSVLVLIPGVALLLGFIYALLKHAGDNIRKNERALYESRERFAQVARISGEVIWEVDAEGRYVYVSPACEEIWGYTEAELVQTLHFYDLHPEEGREEFRRMTLQVFSERKPFVKLRNALKTKQGELRCMLTSGVPLLDAAGALRGYRGSDSDITEQLRSEEAIRRERSLLATIIDAVAAPLFYKDSSGRYLGCNAAFAELLGRPVEEILGKTVFEVSPGELAQLYHRKDLELLVNGEDQVYEAEVTRADGSRRTVLFHKAVFRAPDGSVAGLVGAMLDITARKQAEAALAQQKAYAQAMAERAEQANAAKSAFLANMSHEIRTPMNGILGMIKLVLEEPLAPEQREDLLLVRNSAESLLTIINDILDFSKVEAGRLTLNRVPFSLRQALRKTSALLAPRIREKDLELVLDIAEDVPDWLMGDEVRLMQILTNLLGNAVKFTPDGGGVCLFVAVEQPRAAECEDVTLHIAVSDTGIGVEPEQIERIFDAFVQADGSATRQFGGTGLGLSIARQLVELMGGRMWLDSRVGIGSVFHFAVTLQRAAAQPGASPTVDEATAAAGPPQSIRPLHVLVVEDNPVNRLLVRKILTKWGHRITEALNGQDAVAAVSDASEFFDIILMDCQMPVLDGFAATAMIRAREAEMGRHIPIIALTAHAMGGDAERCLSAGMDDYLSKPFESRALLQTVVKWGGGPHSR